MEKTNCCSAQSCHRPPSAHLEGRAYCRDHFISTCYEQLDQYIGWQQEHPFSDQTAAAVRQFLDDCTREANALAKNTRDLNNLERARLVDILSQARNLSRHLRRSERKAQAIPVLLRSETPGHFWEETTETQLLSRYGALLECHHVVRNKETLVVVRKDVGREARAQVAWRRKKGPVLEIAIEFLNADNFWEMDWTALASCHPQPESVSRPVH